MDDNQIDQAIENTLFLTEQVRKYLVNAQKNDPSPKDGDPLIKLESTRFSSRLINLLANTLSWLMWCKAVNAKEIGQTEFIEKTNEFNEMTIIDVDIEGLPSGLIELVDRSNLLLEQIFMISASVVKSH